MSSRTPLELPKLQISSDGTRCRLTARGEDGQPASVDLSSDEVSGLLMTFPGVLREQLRRQYGDDSRLQVFALSDWKLRRADCEDVLVLSLQSPDGFEVSFATSKLELMRIAGTAIDDTPAPTGASRIH